MVFVNKFNIFHSFILIHFVFYVKQCFNFNLKQKDTKSRETKNEPNKNEAQNEINNYSTVTSQRSFLSLESRIIDFPHGEIEFIDGLQRLKRVSSKLSVHFKTLIK